MRLTLLTMLAAPLVSIQPDPLEAGTAWIAAGEFCEPETVLQFPGGMGDLPGIDETVAKQLSLDDFGPSV